MNVIEDAASEGGKAISRQGAWAVLAVGLVVAFLMGIGYVGKRLLPATEAFIAAAASATTSNSAALDKMANAMETVHTAHANMMGAVKETTDQVTKNGTQIKQNGDAITESSLRQEEMLKMMKQAFVMMENAPQQRDEQIVMLNKIDQSIKELTESLRKP